LLTMFINLASQSRRSIVEQLPNRCDIRKQPAQGSMDGEQQS
jgi:hypothetical protein